MSECKSLHIQHYSDKLIATFCLPTITCQKISSMIRNSEVILKKCKATISPNWTPLLNSPRHTFQSAKKRHKHIPVQGIADKSCTVEFL